MHDINLVIDALFGIGLSRMAPWFEQFECVLHEWYFHSDSYLEGYLPHIVAIDQPSGLCSDSGRELTNCEGMGTSDPTRAHLTVTFHRAKTGHYIDMGPSFGGKLRVVDIGLKEPRPTSRGIG